jgi:signal transduction histidine kinase
MGAPSQILLVDDEEGILMLMADALRIEGYDVDTVNSGRSALQRLSEKTPDLMLLDLKLRDVDGPALLEKIQRSHPRMPFVVVTGQGDEKVAVQVMKQGALDYVMKNTAMLDLLPTVVKRALAVVEQERALAAAQMERKRLEQAILEIGERERHSIGADLHDGLGQQLTAIEFMCTALKEDATRTESDFAKPLAEMSLMLREAVAQTRFLARGLVPVGHGSDALELGLAELVERTNALGRIHCHLECPVTIDLKDPAKAAHLYRIAQEAINNALKHSNAKNVTIRITQNATSVLLEIVDDGAGLPKGASANQGLGLGVMRYRANVIGAELTVSSKRAEGVSVSCRLPLSQ